MPGSILFDHIAFGAPAIADTTDLLVGRFGGKNLGGSPSGGFNFWQWGYRGGGVIEVIEPLGPPGGFVHRFLARHGPSIHHVTFKVADLERTCRRAREIGYQVVGYDDSEPGWKEAFLHPKQALGIVVQFAESDPESSGGGMRRTAPPPSPPPAVDPVTVVGLRMRCGSASAARRLWVETAGGEPENDGEMLVFRWPESPMRLAVEIDPEAAPGPIAVEIAGGAPPAPDFYEPSVGARFVVV